MRIMAFQIIEKSTVEQLIWANKNCYLRQAAGDLKEMHWKVVVENKVMDVRSVFTQVNLTVGTIQKVVTEVLIWRMFTDPV